MNSSQEDLCRDVETLLLGVDHHVRPRLGRVVLHGAVQHHVPPGVARRGVLAAVLGAGKHEVKFQFR